jgi:hypothetical protein
MAEDDIDLGGKGSPDAKAGGAVAGIIEAAHAVVLLRRCVHIILPRRDWRRCGEMVAN